MQVAETIDDVRDWTSSSQQSSPQGGLVRRYIPASEPGHAVLVVGLEEVPRVIREANQLVERALAKDFKGKFSANTRPEAPRLMWEPAGVFIYVGLGMPITSPDAESRRFVVQNTPVVADPARIVERIKMTSGLSRREIGRLVRVSRQSVNNWRRKQPIAPENRRRLLAVLDIFDRARQRYPTKIQLETWLHTPCTTEGKTPGELIIAGEYDQARYYAVARPSAAARSLPAWATRPIPDRFAGAARNRREGSPAELAPRENSQLRTGE